MPKKLTVDDVKTTSAEEPSKGPMVDIHFPLLGGWLCDATYEDGSRKGKTRLQLERKAGRMVATLKDSDSGLCVEAVHESLQDTLLTLELLLGHEDCPWTLDPFPMWKPGAKKKK